MIPIHIIIMAAQYIFMYVIHTQLIPDILHIFQHFLSQFLLWKSYFLSLCFQIPFRCGSELPTLEVSGCEWCYTLVVVQARNDDDDCF